MKKVLFLIHPLLIWILFSASLILLSNPLVEAAYAQTDATSVSPLTLAQKDMYLDTLASANQLYENGRYAEAVQVYEQLLGENIQDGTIFYNLGNAYFKQNRIGHAIVNYERAIRLLPRDEDVVDNLAFARSQILDAYSIEDASLSERISDFSRRWITVNELAIVALSLWVIVAGFIFIYRYLRTSTLKNLIRYGLIITVALFLLVILILGNTLYTERVNPDAIVLHEEIQIQSGPGEQYITEFTLHSGSKVSVLEARGAWTRIALPNSQLQGWTETQGIEPILHSRR
ncbi:MAG: tetratricopeptide repeat protein [Chloroflexota bacterium]